MQMTRNKIKNIVLFLSVCILLGLGSVLRVHAADTSTNTPTVLMIYANYAGGAAKVGEEIDQEKLTVMAVYSNGSTEQVEDYVLSTYTVLTTGTNSVTVVYQGKSARFTVIGKTPKSLSVIYTGGRISVGNCVGAAEVSVRVYYTDGSSEEVTDFSLGNAVITTVGTQKVTVGYQGLTTSFTVYGVSAKPMQSLMVTYNGRTVIEGNPVASKDLYVTAVYTDGTTERIYNYTMNPAKIESLGMTTVTVSYRGKSGSFNVEAIVKTLESISAKYSGASVEVGRYVNKANLVVKAHYNDGSEEVITDYSLMPARILTLGNNTVSVEYTGMKATFRVVGVNKTTANYDQAAKFTATNGKKSAAVEIALPSGISSDAVTGKSLKPARVKKVLGKIKAQDAEYIAFDILLEDETQDDLFPLTMRVSLPYSYALNDTNLYYTPNRKTVLAQLNVERLTTRKLELTIYHPGTYILVYQEPEEEDEEEEKESDYLD